MPRPLRVPKAGIFVQAAGREQGVSAARLYRERTTTCKGKGAKQNADSSKNSRSLSRAELKLHLTNHGTRWQLGPAGCRLVGEAARARPPRRAKAISQQPCNVLVSASSSFSAP